MGKRDKRIDLYIANSAPYAQPVLNHLRKLVHAAWVTEAKTEATRQKRLETAIEWMAEGKIRNWKYAR